MFLLKERQKHTQSVRDKKQQGDFAVSRSDRRTGNRSPFLPAFFTMGNGVIQRCGSDEEEEEQISEQLTYQQVLDLYREKKRGEEDENFFETFLENEGDADYYQCMRYIIENDIERLDNEEIWVVYEIKYCALVYYTCDLLDFDNELRGALVSKAQQGQYYENWYIELLKSNKRIWKNFFLADKKDLDAVWGLGEGIFLTLLKEDSYFPFLAVQTTFLPWLKGNVIADTLDLESGVCRALAGIFPPADFDVLPHIAKRVRADLRIGFFQKCKLLGLGKNAIEEIAGKDYEGFIQDDVSALGSVSKDDRFFDWIKVLYVLFVNGKVSLNLGRRKTLPSHPGKPLTDEIKIYVKNSAGKVLDNFVYHEHPKEKNPQLSYRHIKPRRGCSSTVHMHCDQIPPFIKTLLGIPDN